MLQVHGARKSLNIVDTVKYMLKEGGVMGLWRGNLLNVIKIAPESALKFGAYEEIKKWIKGSDNRELTIYERLWAGSLAGATAQTVIYPLEVMKTRMLLRRTGEYSGMWDCAYKIYKSGGLYRGYWPNLFGIIPYAGIDLAVYETVKKTWLERTYDPNEPKKQPGSVVLLLCGTFSSCCGQLAAYPCALIRTKLQSQAGTNLNLPYEQTHAIGLFR